MPEQDITTISLEELNKDLQDSINDIYWCQTALNLGIEDVNGMCLRYRMFRNCEIVEIIEAELARRSMRN